MQSAPTRMLLALALLLALPGEAPALDGLAGAAAPEHGQTTTAPVPTASPAHSPAPPADNPELARLYQEDQADRAVGPNGKQDWEAVSKRDDERRARIRAIVAERGARTAADHYHAAMVYQHGSTVADFEEAHRLALRAAELDPSHKSAKWLAAAANDRSLMNQGKPQLYGTQFKLVDGKWVLWEVDPSITDEERAKWGVPPLAEARARAEKLNAEREKG
jgi:hypothetical protein